MAVVGARRWFLYNASRYSCDALDEVNTWHADPTEQQERSTGEWLSNVWPRLSPRLKAPVTHCEQQPGDAIYVPASWMHAVYNYGDRGPGGAFGVAVAVNRDYAASYFEPKWNVDGERIILGDDGWRCMREGDALEEEGSSVLRGGSIRREL